MFFFKLSVSFPIRKAKDVLISENLKDILNVLVGTSFVIFIFFPLIHLRLRCQVSTKPAVVQLLHFRYLFIIRRIISLNLFLLLFYAITRVCSQVILKIQSKLHLLV